MSSSGDVLSSSEEAAEEAAFLFGLDVDPDGLVVFAEEKDMVGEYEGYDFVELKHGSETADEKPAKGVELLKTAYDDLARRDDGYLMMAFQKVYKIIQIQVFLFSVRLVVFFVYFSYYFVGNHCA